MKLLFAGIGAGVLLGMVVSRYRRPRYSLEEIATELQQHFPHTSANPGQAPAA